MYRSVSKCIEVYRMCIVIFDTPLSIQYRDTFCSIHIRYVTIQVMGKMHPDTWGKRHGIPSPLARCSTGTDCECRRAYAAGLERRAARGSEASSQKWLQTLAATTCAPLDEQRARAREDGGPSLPPTHLPSHATCAVACYALPHEPPRTPEATRREIRLPVADRRADCRPTLIRLPSELQLRDHVLMSPLVSLDPSLT